MRSLALFAVLLLPAGRPDSKYLAADLKGDRAASYVVVAADAFAEECDALLAHREKGGLKVAIVRASDVYAAYGEGKASADAIALFLKHAAARWGTKFVLLAGDADAVPTFARASQYQTDKFPNDAELASDHPYAEAGVAVGRFPADTKEELASMIAKTVDYETKAAPGPWQRKLSLIASEGGFGALVDTFIEAQFKRIVATIPAGYRIEFAYGKATSPYCPHPPDFSANVVRMLNEGPLFCVYMGHGSRTGCDFVEFKGNSCAMFDEDDVKELKIAAASPIMVVIACNTGEFDSKAGDCLGETLLKSRTGPVAFVGGTRVTQPYGNALLGRLLIDACLASKPTVGEALFEAKRRLFEKDESAFRKLADTMAGGIQGFDSLEPIRKDTAMHYNLLGDPALAIRRPGNDMKLEASAAKRIVTVKGQVTLKQGRAILSVDCPQDKFVRKPGKIASDDPELPALFAKRYAASNEKSLVLKEVAVKDGAFEAELELPAKTPEGKYVVRSFAWDEASSSAGSAELTVEE